MLVKTAGLIVEITPICDLTASRLEPYRYYGSDLPDISISLTKEYYEMKREGYVNSTLADSEYIYSGACFYEKAIAFGTVLLHSSCVEYNGKAYLFSADSGTGKSTHTHLWLKYLDGARIINDDKPAIRRVDSGFKAFGTPWSGKTDESIDVGVDVGGICFLERGTVNKIERISVAEGLKLFMAQTVRPHNKALMQQLLTLLSQLFTEIPVYKLQCDISEEAVRTAVAGMTSGQWSVSRIINKRGSVWK